MTTGSQAFFSTAAPRSRRASCSGVRPFSRRGANLSIIPIQAALCDLSLNGAWKLACYGPARGDLASQRAARDVRSAPETFDDPLGTQTQRGDLRPRSRPRARPAENDDRHKRRHAVRLVPRAEKTRRIPAKDEKQLIVRVGTMQVRHGVRGIGESASLDLHVRNFETRFVLSRQAHHLETVTFGGQRRGAMRRSPARYEQHAVEMRALHCEARRRHVTLVNRIERTA